MAVQTTQLRAAAITFLASGVAIITRAIIGLADPTYWNPESLLDYTAAILSTIAWVLAGAALILWFLATPEHRLRWFLLIAGVGVAVSGVGNLLEDVFDMPVGEFLFTIGGMVGALALMMATLAVLTVAGPVRWSAAFLFLFVAGSTFPDDGGEFVMGASIIGLGFWLLTMSRRAQRGGT